ncbi:MAG: NlpC/P60 family protein, partial [Candidatus Acidiferrum sp.]
MRTRFKCRVVRKPFSILEIMCWRMVWICLIAAAPAVAQVAVPVHDSDSSPRLLSVEEGRSIVNVAWQQESPEAGMRDCSHAVHQIFATAGFEYPYASSFEIYAGNENFERVKNPHTGDLIAWPGHVGIVVDPLQHSFYSLVRTGLEAQDYESAYWKSRGKPRFYRYKVETGGVVSAANLAGSSRG